MHTNLSRQYLLVTPVKNEENYLPGLIKSIVNQTIKPVLWVIVDDRSTDNTLEIIKKAKETYEWLQFIRLDQGVRDRGAHLAKVIKTGFDFAYEYCDKNNMDFNYLGNVDADVVLDHTYFEKLIEKFELDANLGVASGIEFFINDEKMKKYTGSYPSGGDVLYRRKCYEECGGIPLSGLWDSVMNTKAELRNWSLMRFDDSKVSIMRGYSHADGLWVGYKKLGESSYSLNFNIVYAIAKGLKLLSEKPYYIGFAYLNGYLGSLIMWKEQIKDEEIKYYYNHTRLKQINQYYIDALRNKLRFRIRL